jgi:hypothetical protein
MEINRAESEMVTFVLLKSCFVEKAINVKKERKTDKKLQIVQSQFFTNLLIFIYIRSN